MKVYFLDSNDRTREIGDAQTEQEVLHIINDFLVKHNYKSYYTRRWEENGKIWYDVGSHSEYFYTEK